MTDSSGNSYEANIGDNANVVAVGNGISQFRAETHIHLSKALDEYAQPVESAPDKSKTERPDWITLTIGGIFFIINVTSVFVPLLIYQEATATINTLNWLLPLTSAMAGITGLMGVLVGYRISSRLRR